jgi:ankyrin repeat protein
VARGNLEETAALLGLGADTDGRLGGRTALMIAAERGRRDLVDRLIVGGARVEAETERGETALIFAVRGGHRAAAQALLAHGADANTVDLTTDVLGRPVQSGKGERLQAPLRVDLTTDVLRRPVPPPSPRSAPAPTATAAAPNGAAGTRRPQPPPVGRPVLRIAVDNGDVALASALLAHGAAVKTPSAGSRPILAAALAHDDSAMALALLKQGAGLTPERDTAWTARVLPAPPRAERLLPPPALPPGVPVVLPPGVGDLPAPDLSATVTKTAWTPLMAVATCCDAAVVKALLAKGANADCRTRGDEPALCVRDSGLPRVPSSSDRCTPGRDWTPLRAAASLGHLGVVRVLAAHGVDVNAKGADGVTVLTAALEGKHLGTARLLLDQGTPNAGREVGRGTGVIAGVAAGPAGAAALFEAAQRGEVELARGAAINARDPRGRIACPSPATGIRTRSRSGPDRPRGRRRPRGPEHRRRPGAL